MTEKEWHDRYLRICVAVGAKSNPAQEIEWFSKFKKWSPVTWNRTWERVKENLGQFMPALADFDKAWNELYTEDLRRQREEREAQQEILNDHQSADPEVVRLSSLLIYYGMWRNANTVDPSRVKGVKRLAEVGARRWLESFRRLYKPGDYSLMLGRVNQTYRHYDDLRERAEKEQLRIKNVE